MINFFKSFLLLFCFAINLSYSQNKKIIDSLEIEISKKQTVKNLIENYYKLSKEYLYEDRKKCIGINSKILDLSKKNNYKKGIAHYFLLTAQLSSLNQKNLEAKNYSKKAREIYFDIKEYEKYLLASYSLCYSLSTLNKLDESTEEAKKCIIFIKKNKVKYNASEFMYVIANNYGLKKDYANALKYYNLCISNTRKQKVIDNYMISANYYSIADIYDELYQYKKAKQFILKSIEIDKKSNSAGYLHSSYSLLASILLDLKEYKEAIKHIKLNSIYFKKQNDLNSLSYDLNTLAQIYYEQKKYNLSIENCKEILNFGNEIIETNIIDAQKTLGKCYFELKDYKSSLEYQKKVLLGMEKMENDISADYNFTEFYKEISNTEFALGDYKNAYIHSNNFYKINEKKLTEEKTNRINELLTKFEVSEKENELKNSLNERQKKDIEIQKQNNKIILISSILLASLLSIFLLIRIFFINKNKNHQLQSKNLIIEQKNNELSISKIELEKLLSIKDVLLKEIHHRVKNNLQLIISLLNIQSRSGNSISTEEFVEKSLARITSMSLVHQNLYQNNDIEKVNFHDYLNNLTKSVSSSFPDSHCEIKITCQEIYFLIETAIPLGLIINELMYNSYKYAFPNNQNGLIEIKVEKSEKNYKLIFIDSGIGFDEVLNTGKSMGMKLVKLLTTQISGTFEKTNAQNTEFIIEFEQINA